MEAGNTILIFFLICIKMMIGDRSTYLMAEYVEVFSISNYSVQSVLFSLENLFQTCKCDVPTYVFNNRRSYLLKKKIAQNT